MTEFDAFLHASRRAGLLLDTNVLVLFIVGQVNRARITQFKRTQKYDEAAFDLLVRFLQIAAPSKLLAVPHVFAEVSNLTDISGSDRNVARIILSEQIKKSTELPVASLSAARHVLYRRLGLTDAAIAVAAAEHSLAALTDDLDLYLELSREGVATVNFTHILQLGLLS